MLKSRHIDQADATSKKMNKTKPSFTIILVRSILTALVIVLVIALVINFIHPHVKDCLCIVENKDFFREKYDAYC